MVDWESYTKDIGFYLGQLSVGDVMGKTIEPNSAFNLLKNIAIETRAQSRTIFFVGNGASASMASHAAADLALNGHVRTETFTDLSLLTAIANDISYDRVFSEPLRRRMVPGDVLVAISSSGNSPNVVNAARDSAELGGIVVTLSAMSGNNALRCLGSLNFYVPAPTYGVAESCHATILHHWIDLVVRKNEVREDRPHRRPQQATAMASL